MYKDIKTVCREPEACRQISGGKVIQACEGKQAMTPCM